MNLVKQKQRVADRREVFMPAWMAEAMLDLEKDETERIDARFLEPACGSGAPPVDPRRFLRPYRFARDRVLTCASGRLPFSCRSMPSLSVLRSAMTSSTWP